MTSFIKRPVAQIAYVVDDVRASARRMAQALGAGPFFIGESIPLAHCLYRGREMPLDHTNACGQWGDVMIELVQQNNDGPSAFRDMYPKGSEGMHHVATFVEDFDAEVARYAALGCEAANIAVTEGGNIRFAYIDARPLCGHMIEFYQDSEVIRGFYKMVKDASLNWDGQNPILER
jgi:hypothetical protein